MMEIREKPVQAAHIKEKVISAPNELLRKGLDDGTERLRTQFRDTAQQGQRDEYGGDAVEDTAAGAVRRAEKLLRKRGEHTERRTAPEGENAPGPRSGTTSYHAGRTRGTSALYSSSQQNRAEEVYVRRAAGPKTGGSAYRQMANRGECGTGAAGVHPGARSEDCTETAAGSPGHFVVQEWRGSDWGYPVW